MNNRFGGWAAKGFTKGLLQDDQQMLQGTEIKQKDEHCFCLPASASCHVAKS